MSTVLAVAGCFASRANANKHLLRPDKSDEDIIPTIRMARDELPRDDLFHFVDCMSDTDRDKYYRARQAYLERRGFESYELVRALNFEIVLLRERLEQLEYGSEEYFLVLSRLNTTLHFLHIVSFEQNVDNPGF